MLAGDRQVVVEADSIAIADGGGVTDGAAAVFAQRQSHASPRRHSEIDKGLRVVVVADPCGPSVRPSAGHQGVLRPRGGNPRARHTFVARMALLAYAPHPPVGG